MEPESLAISTSETADPLRAPIAVPQWDRKRRRLYFRGELVKAFTSPAKNQVAILDAFQKHGWPLSINSPLAGNNRKNLRKKSENVVNRLNGNQHAQRLRFHVCDSGRKIWWEEIL